MMLRRFAIGCTALGTLAFPASAWAQNQQNLCDALQGAKALSPYVQKILDRAEKGITFALSAPPRENTDNITEAWQALVENAGAAVVAGMDSQRRITSTIQGLVERSSCLRYDGLLLSCEIEKVRTKLNLELSLAVNKAPSAERAYRLQELLAFLFDRDRHLFAGANDPWYADPDFNRVYAFDEPKPGFCCSTGDEGIACEAKDIEECEPGSFWSTSNDCEQECGITKFPPEDPRLCPYNSDYAEPTEGGYGCDETIMPNLASVADERTALQELRQEVDKLREQANSSDKTSSSSEATSASSSSRPAALIGCASIFGHCNDETALICTTSSDCEDNSECVFQKGTCLNKPSQTCTKDVDCSTSDPKQGSAVTSSVCILPPTSPPATILRKGPFSLDADQLRLMASYMSWNTRTGANRPFGGAFAEPREDSDSNSSLYIDPFEYIINTSNRADVRVIGAQLGADQARLAPLSETSDTLAEMLKPLRKATASFASMASLKDGIRKLVREFSSYLRRNCLGNACENDLERVWSIANTKECFPYANGAYQKDRCTIPEESRAQKCADAAGIPIQVEPCSSSSSST